jgi:hypothetical protein
LQADCRRPFARRRQRDSPPLGRTRQWAGSDNADPAHSSSLGEGGIFPQGNDAETVFTVLSFVDLLMSRLCRSLETALVRLLILGRSRCETPWSHRPKFDVSHHALLNRDEAHDDGSDECVGTVRDVELLEYGGEVVLRCLGADVQPLGDLAVRGALSQELQDFEFALRQ